MDRSSFEEYGVADGVKQMAEGGDRKHPPINAKISGGRDRDNDVTATDEMPRKALQIIAQRSHDRSAEGDSRPNPPAPLPLS